MVFQKKKPQNFKHFQIPQTVDLKSEIDSRYKFLARYNLSPGSETSRFLKPSVCYPKNCSPRASSFNLFLEAIQKNRFQTLRTQNLSLTPKMIKKFPSTSNFRYLLVLFYCLDSQVVKNKMRAVPFFEENVLKVINVCIHEAHCTLERSLKILIFEVKLKFNK